MECVKIAFQYVPNGKRAPNGYQYLNCYKVFDGKLDDFRRMACLVAGSNMIKMLNVITYSSMVTRERVCIDLTMAVIHKQEVKASVILNDYVMASSRENIWAVLGSKLGDDAKKIIIIVRALFVLNHAGASYHA